MPRSRRAALRWSPLVLALLLAACGGVNPSVTSVAVTLGSGALLVGQTTQAEAAVTAVGGASTAVVWASSDTAVATVDAGGQVTAVGAGTADITATSTFAASVSGSAAVTVHLAPAVTDLTVSGPIYLRTGRQALVTAEITVVGGAGEGIVWTSSNDAVATVNGSGLVTGVSEGSAFIQAASAADPSVTAQHAVQVVAQAWDTGSDAMPTAMARGAALIIDGALYIIGGEVLAGRWGNVLVYHPHIDTWATNLPAMPAARSNHCAARIGDAIYVPGGWDDIAYANLYRFDLTSRTWTELVDDALPETRYAHACAVHEGRLYLLGGAATSAEPWVFDPEAPSGERWTTGLAAMPILGRYGGAVTVGEHIYYAGFVLGGSTTSSAAVLRYHPASDSWASLPDLQTARGGAGVWSDGRFLYVAGGGWAGGMASIEVYDLEQGLDGSWVLTDPLPQARFNGPFSYAYDPVTEVVYAAGGYSGGFLDRLDVGRGLAPAP